MKPPPTLKVDHIPEEGLDLDIAFDPAWLAEVLASSELAPVAGREGGARVRVDLDKRNVILTGRFDTVASATCVACLEPVELALGADFTLLLEPATPAVNVVQRGAVPDEHELSPGELDVDAYENGEVDLSHWLREQIVLEAPVHPRHEGDCPTPLTVPTADHGASDETADDPRLAPLRRLMTNKE